MYAYIYKCMHIAGIAHTFVYIRIHTYTYIYIHIHTYANVCMLQALCTQRGRACGGHADTRHV